MFFPKYLFAFTDGTWYEQLHQQPVGYNWGGPYGTQHHMFESLRYPPDPNTLMFEYSPRRNSRRVIATKVETTYVAACPRRLHIYCV